LQIFFSAISLSVCNVIMQLTLSCDLSEGRTTTNRVRRLSGEILA